MNFAVIIFLALVIVLTAAPLIIGLFLNDETS